jgi:hypothetical protein
VPENYTEQIVDPADLRAQIGETIMEAQRRFLFRGHAVAVAGEIRRPKAVRIPSQCSLALPSTGGAAHVKLSKTNFENILSFDSAEAIVDGDYQSAGGKSAVDFTFGNHRANSLPAKTTVGTLVSGLTVTVADQKTTRTLKVAKLGATLISEHPGTSAEPSIRAEGTELKGLSIDGCGLEVSFHDLFNLYATKEAMGSAYRTAQQHFNAFDRCLFTPPGRQVPEGTRLLPEEGGTLHGTIVNEVRWTNQRLSDVTIEGNRITIPDFGTVFLGEIYVASHERRLIMLRLQIGSPVGGETDVGDLSSDGHLWPP